MLPAEARSLLSLAAHIAGEHGWPAYLVGGSVRDVLLGRHPTDLDVSVVGDALVVAQELAVSLGIEVEGHERFGTSRVTPFGGQYYIDFVTARRESYPTPGALPQVEAGTLEDDLARRDFTINAMALPLNEGSGVGGLPGLVDPHGGYVDLRAGWVAVLHDGSFRDDPTRLFRAVRFSERLEFGIAPRTLELMLNAVRDGALRTVSIERIARELLLALEEPRAGRMLAAFERLGLLEALYPGLNWPYPPDEVFVSEAERVSRNERRDAYLAGLAAEYAGDHSEAERLARHLRLTAHQVRLMRDAAQLAALWPQLSDSELMPSRLYNLLEPLDANALQAFTRIEKLREDKMAYEKLQFYLDKLRYTRSDLTGEDLRAMGIAPGPIYKQILTELLEARLDGALQTRDDELRFLRERISGGET